MFMFICVSLLAGLVVYLANAVSCVWAMKLTTTETLADSGLASPGNAVIHSGYDESGTLNAGTTPPVTKIAEFLLTLTAGAATIDLRALVGTNNAVIDGNGLKVQSIRIKNLGANPMTFAEGAANGYAFGGTIVTPPGGIDMKYGNDGLPDIAAADKEIDVTGTAAQTAEITIVMG